MPLGARMILCLIHVKQQVGCGEKCLFEEQSAKRVAGLGLRGSIDKAISFYWCGITSFANHNRRKAASPKGGNSERTAMSFPHEIIEIDSDDDEEDEIMNYQLMRYLSTRAADLAAAGITEGELELEFQRVEARQDRRNQARDTRGRYQGLDLDEDNGHGRLNSAPPLPPPEARNRRPRLDEFFDRDEDHNHGRLNRPPPQPQLQSRSAPRAPPPQTPPRQKQKSRIPKPTPKSTPKPKGKPKREPDDMTVDATCIICYNAITNTVLIPCGHLVLCKVCTACPNDRSVAMALTANLAGVLRCDRSHGEEGPRAKDCEVPDLQGASAGSGGLLVFLAAGMYGC